MTGHQETPARETFHPTWLGAKVVKKRGESLDTSKARSAKGTRTFHLRHPQEGEGEDQEGEDQEEEEPTPQTMTTMMIEDIIASTEKCARCELQIALSNLTNRAIQPRLGG